TSLADRFPALENVVYQKGLGSIADKSRRVMQLAARIAEETGTNAAAASRAAELGKCDLVTGMVGEFPGLQGTMGRYYAMASGEDAEVATAIEQQYQPRFAGDDLPSSAEGRAVSLAERLDTLAGAFALGKKPTGNRDPFGLRRSALGIVRICVESRLDLAIDELVDRAIELQPVASSDTAEVHAFVLERLRSYALDRLGVNSDMFAAVRARNPATLVDFADRLLAVRDFVALEAAAALAAANKRIGNILRQADLDTSGVVDEALLSDRAEAALHAAVSEAQSAVTPLIERRAYGEALARLAELRPSVDAFFDDVMVMADEPAVRLNRLRLLSSLREQFLQVADVSRLAIK
ncbi:MAG: glycine--tRNA ligase subunit beta, partial [Pseudomonadota bacterium]